MEFWIGFREASGMHDLEKIFLRKLNWRKKLLNFLIFLVKYVNLIFPFFLLKFAAISPSIAAEQKQQRFRVQPQNLQVLEGSEALLRCEITNLAGAVQWAKDGFALGEFLSFLFCKFLMLQSHFNIS